MDVISNGRQGCSSSAIAVNLQQTTHFRSFYQADTALRPRPVEALHRFLTIMVANHAWPAPAVAAVLAWVLMAGGFGPRHGLLAHAAVLVPGDNNQQPSADRFGRDVNPGYLTLVRQIRAAAWKASGSSAVTQRQASTTASPPVIASQPADRWNTSGKLERLSVHITRHLNTRHLAALSTREPRTERLRLSIHFNWLACWRVWDVHEAKSGASRNCWQLLLSGQQRVTFLPADIKGVNYIPSTAHNTSESKQYSI